MYKRCRESLYVCTLLCAIVSVSGQKKPVWRSALERRPLLQLRLHWKDRTEKADKRATANSKLDQIMEKGGLKKQRI